MTARAEAHGQAQPALRFNALPKNRETFDKAGDEHRSSREPLL
jgi:hypothetical protein